MANGFSVEQFAMGIWDSIPQPLQVVIILIIILLLFSKIKFGAYRELFRAVRKSIIDLKYRIAIYIFQRNERKRIDGLINWKKSGNKLKYKTNAVKIKNTFNEKNEAAFIETSKKTFILVIRQKMRDDKSENLLRAVSQWIIFDFLIDVKKYISTDLTVAMNNIEIISKLREMKDYEAERRFLEQMTTTQEIKDLMRFLEVIKKEGVYENLYIPFLVDMKRLQPTNTEETKEDAVKLLKWFCNRKKRLKEQFKSKYFPCTQFLYVRLPFVEIHAHISRAHDDFKKGCDLLVISGREKNNKSINKVSSGIKKQYPIINSFEGFLEEQEEFVRRRCRVHVNSTSDKLPHTLL